MSQDRQPVRQVHSATHQGKKKKSHDKKVTDKGTGKKTTRPDKWRGNRQPTGKIIEHNNSKDDAKALGNRMDTQTEKIQEMFNKDLETKEQQQQQNRWKAQKLKRKNILDPSVNNCDRNDCDRKRISELENRMVL